MRLREKPFVETMICVVGAGVAGLLTASLINNFEVSVFESLPRIAYREHCAGIISIPTCETLKARDLVDAYYSKMVIDAGFLRFRIECAKAFAVHIDRLGLESMLFDRVRDKGHRVLLRNLATSISRAREGLSLKVLSEGIAREVPCTAIVVAEGFGDRISRACGLSAVRERLVGMQVLAELSARVPEDEIKILFNERLTPRGFAWVAPLSGGRRALIGLVSEPPVLIPIAKARAIAKIMDVQIKSLLKLFGGHVFAGYPRRVVGLRGLAVGIGDCLAMVKSVSGGGLYAISRAAPVIARYLEKGGSLEMQLKPIKSELKKGYSLFKALHRVLRLVPSTRRKLEVVIYLKELNYDNHVEALLTMMKTFGSDSMKIRWSPEDTQR